MDGLNCDEEVQTANEFIAYSKIPRLTRDCIITEKIDGTNAQIYIKDGLLQGIGSKNRWITQEKDNFGFAAWVKQHEQELLKLGDGRHYGEWWGLGIQRGYGLFERRFSIFKPPKHGVLPSCVSLVPVIKEGIFSEKLVLDALQQLISMGSLAAPGYLNPEGIVIWHKASGQLFKKTIEHDEEAKEARERRLKHEKEVEDVTSVISSVGSSSGEDSGQNTKQTGTRESTTGI